MATILVDTDVYSYLTSSNPARAIPYKPHLEGHVIALSFITVGEQYAGYMKKIAKGEWTAAHLARLEERLRLVVIIPYDIEVCRAFGELKSILKNSGGSDRTLASNDLWVAACAKRHGLKLATNNHKHFENIPEVELILPAAVVAS
jgi:predicted nucleic acid-binding protein